VELFDGKGAVDRAAMKAELKTCMTTLQEIAVEKRIVTAAEAEGADAGAPDLGL
jgi:hypothetical protein